VQKGPPRLAVNLQDAATPSRLSEDFFRYHVKPELKNGAPVVRVGASRVLSEGSTCKRAGLRTGAG
ncbi:MAG: hypothetical protein LC808_26720, partial [Actinobacteria bacterium]|nr:hypothetical protein [Actinomycetota bacterium]